MKLLTKLSGTITFKDKQKMRLLLIIFILEIVLFFILGQLYCEARKKMFSERVESVFKAVFCNIYKKMLLMVIFTLVGGNSDWRSIPIRFI